MYFVHSYAAEAEAADVVATCDYGGPVTAMVERERHVGHPVPSRRSPAPTVSSCSVASWTSAGERSPVMGLYPAIDLRGGRCVRLYQGDFDQETVYGDDPVAQARLFADAGREWIHVVDLDAARTGEPVNRPVIAAVAATVGARVQTGGGVRDDGAADALLEAGVTRVVVGTAALDRPSWARSLAGRWPGRVALGLDVRGREVAVRGWVEGAAGTSSTSPPSSDDAGFAALIVTQINVDGAGTGPDVQPTPICWSRWRPTSSRPVASVPSSTFARWPVWTSTAVGWPASSSAAPSTTAASPSTTPSPPPRPPDEHSGRPDGLSRCPPAANVRGHLES